ncbi:MAG: cation:proton antiporter [Bacteroidales bacterium]|nr:cation:proton antiporter [Bacteroidales bacterium]
MSEELNLVRDLALILIASGVFTILSKVLKQPLILGYIVAGFLVGPHMGLFPNVTDTQSVQQWSDIGIIFLLFGLGLEFSFRKLLKVGSAALITAGLNCVGMFMMGLVTGGILGWKLMEGIFLGGMLSMSSTTIIIKAYSDLGLSNKPYAPLVFGILVVEDLIAVLLMVLLSTIAVSNQFSGGAMVLAIAKLVFFLILWFLVGIYLLPTLLRRFRDYLSDEILLLVSLGLCFTMVALASSLGFSSSLGAFVMGSILSETMEGERIEKLTCHIKDLFGAIFFVSVGMMVNPAVIGQYWLPILVLVFVVMVGIFAFSLTGSLLSGKGLSTSTHVAMSLPQLGEFSFIIAGLGASLGVLRDFIYPVIIAVSVITTFTTPYMIKAAGPMENFFRKHLPAGILAKVDHDDVEGSSSRAAQSEWRKLMKAYILRVVLYSVLVIAVVTTCHLILPGLLEGLLPGVGKTVRGLIEAGVTLLAMSPFLYGLAISGGSIKHSAAALVKENRSNGWRILALAILRILIALAFCIPVIVVNVELSGWAILGIIGLLLLVFMVVRVYFHRFSGLESRFFENLNQKEIQASRERPVSTSVNRKLAAYDMRTESFKLSSDSIWAGKQLKDIPIRSSSGVNVVKIQRGHHGILVPAGKEFVYPGDTLVAVGTRDQLDRFTELMGTTLAPDEREQLFKLECFVLGDDSPLCGKMLRETNLRDAGCMVVGVLRGEEMISNPSPELRFQSGDGVWMAGEADSLKWFN